MMFKEFSGLYYFHNRSFLSTDNISIDYLKNGISYYEVLRVINGKPLFLKDHLERFEMSVRKSLFPDFLKNYDFNSIISQLCSINRLKEGNIKMVLNITEKPSLYIYFVPHRYPTPENYTHGIKMLSQKLERPDPAIKAVNLNLREKTESLIQQHGIYEILLVDQNGMVTEGSKSNIFFIKDKKVFTAPEHTVLSGITRKYVFSVCHDLSVDLVEQCIPFEIIASYEAVFISGTSPKILPVKQIDNISFHVNNLTMKNIITRYENIIQKSIL